MNHARLAHSKRLQRVLRLLRSGREYTTMQIVERAKVCAVNSIAAELRAQGFPVRCRRTGDVWRYRLQA